MIGSSLLNKVSFGRFGSAQVTQEQEKTQETLKSMGELNARVNASKNTTFDITEVKYQAGNNSVMAKTPQEALKADFALSYAADQSAPTQDNLDILKTLEDKGYGDAEIIITKPGSDDTNTTIAELIANTDGNVHNPVTTEAVVAEEAPASAAQVTDDGVFKLSSVEDLKNLSQADQDSIKTLDVQGNIIEFEAALANNEITVPKGIEKFKFTLTGEESKIENMKTAIDMTAHHMSNQLSADGIGRAGQQVKFIADFKDIKFSVAFAKAHPSIIGTTDAAKTLKAKMGEHPETRRKTTENIDAILDKALAEVETVTSPTELDYVIPGSIYETEFTGRDNYAQVINTLSNQMGTSTKEKAAELKSRIESKSHEAEVDHSDVTLVDNSSATTAEEVPTEVIQSENAEIIPEGNFDDTSLVTVEEPSIIAEASEAEETTTLSPEEALEALKTDKDIEAYVKATGERVKDQLDDVPELASVVLGIVAENLSPGPAKDRISALARASTPNVADKEEIISDLIKKFVYSRDLSARAMKKGHKDAGKSGNLKTLRAGLTSSSSISYHDFTTHFFLNGSAKETSEVINKDQLKGIIRDSLPSPEEFNTIRDQHLQARLNHLKEADVKLKAQTALEIAATLDQAKKANGKVDVDLTALKTGDLERNPSFIQFLINNLNGNLTIILPTIINLDPEMASYANIGADGLSKAEEALQKLAIVSA